MRTLTGIAIVDAGHPVRSDPAAWLHVVGSAAPAGELACASAAGLTIVGIESDDVPPPALPDEAWARWTMRTVRALHAGDATVPLAWGTRWSPGAAQEWLAADAVRLGAQLDMGRGALEVTVDVCAAATNRAPWPALEASSAIVERGARRFVARIARWIDDPDAVRSCSMTGGTPGRTRIRLLVDGRAAARLARTVRDLVASATDASVTVVAEGPSVPAPPDSLIGSGHGLASGRGLGIGLGI